MTNGVQEKQRWLEEHVAGDPVELGRGRKEPPPKKGCFSMQLTMEAEIPEGKEQNKGGRRGEQDGRKGPSKESTMKGSFEKGEGLIFQE